MVGIDHDNVWLLFFFFLVNDNVWLHSKGGKRKGRYGLKIYKVKTMLLFIFWVDGTMLLSL